MGTGTTDRPLERSWCPEFWDSPHRGYLAASPLVLRLGTLNPKVGSSKTKIPNTHKQENNVSNCLISTCLCPSLEGWLLQLPLGPRVSLKFSLHNFLGDQPYLGSWALGISKRLWKTLSKRPRRVLQHSFSKASTNAVRWDKSPLEAKLAKM